MNSKLTKKYIKTFSKKKSRINNKRISNRKETRKETRKKINNTKKYKEPSNILSRKIAVAFPYYADFIKDNEFNRIVLKLKHFKLKYRTNPYVCYVFKRKTNLFNNRFKVDGNEGNEKYIQFEDGKTTLDIDTLPLYFSEKEILKCKFKNNISPIDDYYKNYDMIKKKYYNPRINIFRENLWQYYNGKQCNNFRATLATSIYLLTGAKSVLDFSAGWGDRLFAACVKDIKYIGIDPNAANETFYKKIVSRVGSKQEILISGAEYLPAEYLANSMKKQNIDKFDLIFTSPPFFDYEIYNNIAQSNNLWTNYIQWTIYFLFYIIYKYLPYSKENGNIILYIQDVGGYYILEPLILMVITHLNITYTGIISASPKKNLCFITFKNKKYNTQYNKSNANGANGAAEALMKYYPTHYKLSNGFMNLIGRDYNGLDLDYTPLDKRKDSFTKNYNIVIENNNKSTLARTVYKMLIIQQPNEIKLFDEIDEDLYYLVGIFKSYAVAYGINFSLVSSKKTQNMGDNNITANYDINNLDEQILCECLTEMLNLHNIKKNQMIYIDKYIKIYDDCLKKIGYVNLIYKYDVDNMKNMKNMENMDKKNIGNSLHPPVLLHLLPSSSSP